MTKFMIIAGLSLGAWVAFIGFMTVLGALISGVFP